MDIAFNPEKNGIEIRFDAKPEQNILDMLRENKFRWSSKQHMWYAKKTEDRMQMVDKICKIFSCPLSNAVKSNQEYKLWEMTRIDTIGDNVDKNLECKDIAAACRKHFRSIFPMCKFSVTSDHRSVNVSVISSPFAKGSLELVAITKYCEKYIDSFQYCTNYDPYGDYGSSYNIYYSSYYNMIDYNYTQTEMTDEHVAMCKEFEKDQADFEKAEEERKQREYEEFLVKQEEERKAAELAQKKHNDEYEEISNAVAVSDADYFVLNLREAKVNKLESIAEYQAQCDQDEVFEEWKYTKAHVTRELHMDSHIYELFSNHLLDDFDFISNMGSTKTTDYRINSMLDYDNMDKEERATVDWYTEDAIAVYCDSKLMFIVDAQGFSYCRYVFLPYEESKKVNHYDCKQILSAEQRDEYKYLADALEDVSADIIFNNDLCNTWNTENFSVYKKKMINWITKNNFAFSIHVVRAAEDETFKNTLYRILNECDSMKDQFENAGFEEGQKLTMIRISDFGGMTVSKIKYKGFSVCQYAQYENAVKFVFRPENKRSDYYQWLYRDVLIYDGWLEVPEEVLWEVLPSPSGLMYKKTKYLSCDTKQYDAIMGYFANIGKKPIVNTYKPMFN